MVTLGEALFWTSVMGQLVWDIISILEDPEHNDRDGNPLRGLPSTLCNIKVFTEGNIDSGCAVA